MYICRHSEGVHTYLLKCCCGTCSSVGMVKGYMVRERLGTPPFTHWRNNSSNRYKFWSGFQKSFPLRSSENRNMSVRSARSFLCMLPCFVKYYTVVNYTENVLSVLHSSACYCCKRKPERQVRKASHRGNKQQ